VQVFIDCNNIWVSLRQGAHHDAQKSTIVTFPKLSLRETFPSGLGAAKSEVHLASPTGAAVAPTAGELISVSLFFTDFPRIFKDSSKPLKIVSVFLMSALGSLTIPCTIKTLMYDLGCDSAYVVYFVFVCANFLEYLNTLSSS
jgi:hypothetical protein